MLSFAIPWVFGVAVAAAAVIALLHLLSVHRPPLLVLPTTRFVSAGDARAIARRSRPNDLVLLLLRVVALLAAGAALAGVRFAPAPATRGELVVADLSRRADSIAIAQSLPHVATNDGRDSARIDDRRFVWVPLQADVGAALPAALHAAAQWRANDPRLRRIALRVLVPSRVRSVDGWRAWREQWPGAVSVIADDHPTADSVTDKSSRGSTVRIVGGDEDDVVAAAFALYGATGAPGAVVVRDSGARDAAPAGGEAITIEWPVSGVPSRWERLSSPDTVYGVATREQALIGQFVRFARAPGVQAERDGGRAIAWWTDGAAAVVERPLPEGCVREVGIRVSNTGDLLLSANAAGLLASLRAPCGLPFMTPAVIATLAGSGALETGAEQDSLADASYFLPPGESMRGSQTLGSVMLLLALVALLLETVRRRDRSGTRGSAVT